MKLKKGDKVKINRPTGPFPTGHIGTITKVDEGEKLPYRIDNSWWVYEDMVEKKEKTHNPLRLKI